MGIAARSMRTEAECLAKAVEMDIQADLSRSAGESQDLHHMADCWRRVAVQAAWQDGLAAAANRVI